MATRRSGQARRPSDSIRRWRLIHADCLQALPRLKIDRLDRRMDVGELMRWLVRLLTPPAGQVLNPGTGTGSTGAAALLERARFLGIESDHEYIPIARARIKHWAKAADGHNR